MEHNAIVVGRRESEDGGFIDLSMMIVNGGSYADYRFEVPITGSGSIEDYAIGDTVKIAVTFPTTA